MNGREFLMRQRRSENRPFCFVPTIVLTAHGRPALIREAFKVGATQFLVKPVTAHSLLQRIEWVLDDDRPYEQEDDRCFQRMHLNLPGDTDGAGDSWVIDAD